MLKLQTSSCIYLDNSWENVCEWYEDKVIQRCRVGHFGQIFASLQPQEGHREHRGDAWEHNCHIVGLAVLWGAAPRVMAILVQQMCKPSGLLTEMRDPFMNHISWFYINGKLLQVVLHDIHWGMWAVLVIYAQPIFGSNVLRWSEFIALHQLCSWILS